MGEKRFQSTYIKLIKINFILYFFAIVGFLVIPAKNLDILSMFLRTTVSIFLLIRFNPYRKVKFTELDRRIVFSAAIFLFSTTTMDVLIKEFMKKRFKTLNNKIFNFGAFHVF